MLSEGASDLDPRSSNLFLARYILTDPAAAPLEEAALLVRGGRIAAVGPSRKLADSHPGAAKVDLGEALLLPPLVNAHTHLELTHYPRWRAEAGEGEPGDFVDWILQVIRIKRRLPQESLAPSLQEGIRCSLAAGTGAVGEILSDLSLRHIYSESPLLGRCYLETLGRDRELSIRRLEAIETAWGEGDFGRLLPGLSPHSLYTLDEEHLREALALAERRGVRSALHFAESPAEIRLLREGAGPLAERLFPAVGWHDRLPDPDPRTLAARLEEAGGLNPRTLLVHGVQVAEEEIARIARAGASVVLCPRSNARLGVGRAPVERYLAAGVPLALGTDSLASCDSLSMWDEIAFARRWFAGKAEPADLLAMGTVGGARALGLEGEMGRLEPGAGAHFQVLTPVSLPSSSEMAEFLASPGRTAEVTALYLDGREVLHNP